MAKVKLTRTTTSDPLGTANRIKTYVGFSSVNRDFDSNTLYDYELARTDLLNAFYIKKGEKLELPDYGTIIYDTLFEPFTSEISKAIEEDVIEIVGRDDIHEVRHDQRQAGSVGDETGRHYEGQRGFRRKSQGDQHGDDDGRQDQRRGQAAGAGIARRGGGTGIDRGLG